MNDIAVMVAGGIAGVALGCVVVLSVDALRFRSRKRRDLRAIIRLASRP